MIEGRATRCPLHGTQAGPRPVWVRLDLLFPRDPDAPTRTVIDGLDPVGDVPGFLVRWERTETGAWLAIVHYAIPYADGRARRFSLKRQLVPATAVRPRVR